MPTVGLVAAQQWRLAIRSSATIDARPYRAARCWPTYLRAAPHKWGASGRLACRPEWSVAIRAERIERKRTVFVATAATTASADALLVPKRYDTLIRWRESSSFTKPNA